MSQTETSDPNIVLKLKGHKKSITCLQFHPHSKQIISGSEDCSIILWNIDTNKRSLHFNRHTNAVTSIDFTLDGQLFASCANDKYIQIWTPDVKSQAVSFTAHDDALTSIKFSPVDYKLVSGSRDKVIKLWDIEKKKSIQQYTGHTDAINSVKFSYDAKMIASLSNDSTFKLFDATNGNLVHSFAPTRAIGKHLALHPNSYYVAVAMSSGSVRLYDIRAMKLKQHYVLHDCTNAVGWHPFANYLITCGNDGEVCILDVAKGCPIYSFSSPGKIHSVAFSEDGTYFASGGDNKLLEIWKTNFIKADNKENITENK